MDPAAAAEACNEYGRWATWGTIGDTFGGLANLITMMLAAGGFWFAWNEVHRARRQHADEVRAAVAREMFRSATFVLLHVKAALDKLSADPTQDLSSERKELDSFAPIIVNVLSDAQLIFDGRPQDLVNRLVDLTADVVTLTKNFNAEKLRSLELETQEVLNGLKDCLGPIATLAS